MKLSEAMRLGAMLKPQSREGLIRNGTTCALGAALDAVGRLGDDETQNQYQELRHLWPILETIVPKPRDRGGEELMYQIWALNDELGWTREQIADYVATLEPSETPDVPQWIGSPPMIDTEMAK